MKRIVFSTDSLSRGGKERQMAILAAYLLQDNWELIIITKRIDKKNNYLTEYKIDSRIIKTYRGIKGYKNQIIKFNPDIVISWDITSSQFNLFLFRLLDFSFVNGSVRHGIRLCRFTHFYRSLICHLSPYVIANSEAGLRVNNLIPGKRRFILYNGIESRFINDLSKPDIEILRNRLIPGYSEKTGLIYVSVANFVPYKDYFSVIKALNRLKYLYRFYYLIIGDGPMRSEIEKLINDYDLDKSIILIGKTENVRDYLFASDIMIHSSRGEGISNSILEGMYAGLPVIATNTGGIPETVFPASSMLFPYKDVEALYNCLLKSRELKASIDTRSKGYQDHLKKFSVEKMVSSFKDIIQTVSRGKWY